MGIRPSAATPPAATPPAPVSGAPERVRLAELVASLSLVCDLGMGQPLGHGGRVCLLAVRFGEQLRLPAEELRTVFYSALLRWIGCTANAHELTQALGDDLSSRTAMATLDPREPAAMAAFLQAYARGPEAAVLREPRAWDRVAAAHCESAVLLAGWLGLGAPVQQALDQVFERWDGEGLPERRAGAEVALAARLTRLAGDAEILDRMAGPEAVLSALHRRAGTVYAPDLAEAFAEVGPGLLAELASGADWQHVLAAEPGPHQRAGGEQLERGLEAMGDFADLKAPWFSGHARGAAALAGRAARALGLEDGEAQAVRRAGLLQDVGRVGVSDAVWEQPGPLDDAQREAVRLHPYLTERALTRSPWLAPLGELAAAHQERLDGSGYHRRLDARTLPLGQRVLAAADAFQAMTEPRPHRPALSSAEVQRELRAEVGRGRLDAVAVDSVLSVAGQRHGRAEGPLGLTPRELEVLGLLARGLRNREIADRLVVSPKTVGRHLESVYAKLGVSTRAAATLRAMQHGLVDAFPPRG